LKFVKSRKTWIGVLCTIIVLTGVQMAFANANVARTISVFNTEGRTTNVIRENGTRVTARNGLALTSGQTLVTGSNSAIYLRMDRQSILRMGASSRILIEEASNRLSLVVERGNALVQVAEQADGDSIVSRVGTVAMTVRGTMFTTGVLNDVGYIAMLSGSGEIDGEIIEAGQIMTTRERRGEVVTLVTPIRLNELNAFTLEAILENEEYLLENSDFIDEEMLEAIPEILNPPPPVVEYTEYHHEDSNQSNQGETPDPPPVMGTIPMGDGSQGNPFRLTEFGHLIWVANNRGSFLTNFRLDADIAIPAGVDWQGIGVTSGTRDNPTRENFEGMFNGNGFTISGFSSNQGLFSAIGPSGVVINLTVRGDITNATLVTGGITDVNLGYISRVAFIGNISGTNSMGGIVGSNLGANGVVEIAFFDGNLHTTSGFVGGIAGENSVGAIIQNTYSQGNIRSEAHAAGGIVGNSNGGIIRHSYSTANVAGADHTGGILGTGIGTLDGVVALNNSITATHPAAVLGLVAGNSGNISGNAFALESIISGIPLGFNGTLTTAEHWAERSSWQAAGFFNGGVNLNWVWEDGHLPFLARMSPDTQIPWIFSSIFAIFSTDLGEVADESDEVDETEETDEESAEEPDETEESEEEPTEELPEEPDETEEIPVTEEEGDETDETDDADEIEEPEDTDNTDEPIEEEEETELPDEPEEEEPEEEESEE